MVGDKCENGDTVTKVSYTILTVATELTKGLRMSQQHTLKDSAVV